MRTRRWLVVVGVLSLLSLGLAAPAVADTCTSSYTRDLKAGSQGIVVGTVTVCNDGSGLDVTFATTGSWRMSSTYVHTADSLGGIPQTKTGNPTPGKFAYKAVHAPWVGTYAYEGVVERDFVAAHAEVWDTASSSTVTTFSNTGDNIFGPVSVDPFDGTPFDAWGTVRSAVQAVNWLGLIAPDLTDLTAYAAYHWGSPLSDATQSTESGEIPGARWISTAADTEDITLETWRYVTDTLVLPGPFVPGSGSLLASSDNEYWAYLGGVEVGHDAELFEGGTSAGGVDSYTPAFAAGANQLGFIFKNGSGGTTYGNPNGLVFKASASYYDRKEGAWAAGSAFPGANWATYFLYNPTLFDSVTVDSAVAAGATSDALVNGKSYMIKVTGTWMNGGINALDAEYSTLDSWATQENGYDHAPYLLGEGSFDLRVDGAFVNWGSYDTSHTYYRYVTGTGSGLNFAVFEGDFDADPVVHETGWYGDNTGTLTVDIFQLD